MLTRRGHELANGGGFGQGPRDAEVPPGHSVSARPSNRAPALRPRRRVASSPVEAGGPARALLPSGRVTPIVVIAAGLVAIAIGTVLLRSYGPRARVGRLLVVTPLVTVAEARAIATAGRTSYVRVDGRLDADDEFADEHERPLVYRRRRIEARLAGGWKVLDDRREQVRFRVREGLDEMDVDAEALGDGLVTLVRESSGTAGEVPDLLPTPLAPSTPVRVRVEQLSSVEHVSVLGVPVRQDGGEPRLTAGSGRPLVVSALDRPEAMRVLAGGNRARPIAAAIALAAGMVLLTAGLGWALAAGFVA